jgi:hypothetical protein
MKSVRCLRWVLPILGLSALTSCGLPSPNGLSWKAEEIKVGMTIAEVDTVLEPPEIESSGSTDHLKQYGINVPKIDRPKKRSWEVLTSGTEFFDEAGAATFTGVMVWVGREKDNEKGVYLKLTFKDGKIAEKAIIKESELGNLDESKAAPSTIPPGPPPAG